MFQFLQPILLISIAGIAVPVIIHLWNIRQGKTLKIGSVALLIEGSIQSARSLKLTDLLLLFLRCLLIVLLALLIAKPVFKQEITAKKEKGWILLEKEHLQEGYAKNKSTIDSLLKAGFEFHYFEPGFRKDNIEEVMKTTRDTSNYNAVSYWGLLSQLNEEIPGTLPVYLFTDNRLKRFAGERPEISLNLHWQTYLLKDSVSGWPAKSFLTPTDSIRLIVGNSNSFATNYTHENLSLNQASMSGYGVDIIKGKLTVSLKDNAQNKKEGATSAIEVDTTTIRITIFTDKFNDNANYVRAAIQSIRSFSKRKMELYSTNNYRNIPANQDWIFWLSEVTMPELNNVKNIFKYENGKLQNVHSWITGEDKTTNAASQRKGAKLITLVSLVLLALLFGPV